jgi:hypothetical protein
MLIPNGPLREASEPAPGYSAFLKKDPASSLTHSLILIKDQPLEIAERNRWAVSFTLKFGKIIL